MIRSELAALLAAEGFVAATEEADELVVAAAGDVARLDALVARRRTGEPLAWVTGTVAFCGLTLHVAPRTYVPRWHTEALALRAVERLPARGTAVDVCCGTGAIAAVLADRRPGARVLATDVDPVAVACARSNGVDARVGDLLGALPAALDGAVDVVVGVVPYVPPSDFALLQRDTFAFETPLAYDGGPDGCDLLRRVIADAPRRLRAGGALLLELGADLADRVAPDLERHGFGDVAVLFDEEGDPRGIEATAPRRPVRAQAG